MRRSRFLLSARLLLRSDGLTRRLWDGALSARVFFRVRRRLDPIRATNPPTISCTCNPRRRRISSLPGPSWAAAAASRLLHLNRAIVVFFRPSFLFFYGQPLARLKTSWKLSVSGSESLLLLGSPTHSSPFSIETPREQSQESANVSFPSGRLTGNDAATSSNQR